MYNGELKYIIVKFLLHESEYPYKMAVHLLMNICQRIKFHGILWMFCNSSTPKTSICLTLAMVEQKYLLKGEFKQWTGDTHTAWVWNAIFVSLCRKFLFIEERSTKVFRAAYPCCLFCIPQIKGDFILNSRFVIFSLKRSTCTKHSFIIPRILERALITGGVRNVKLPAVT